MSEQVKAKIFIFGPWVRSENGEVVIEEGGQKVASWLNGSPIELTEELWDLLKTELAHEKDYRKMIAAKLNEIRSKYLDETNRVIPDLTNPGKTIVEAYNNGMKMGEHQAGANMAMQLSDLMDKIHIMEVIEYEGTGHA